MKNKMRVYRVDCGVCANHNNTLHFVQNDDENIMCLETGEVFGPEEFIIENEK